MARSKQQTPKRCVRRPVKKAVKKAAHEAAHEAVRTPSPSPQKARQDPTHSGTNSDPCHQCHRYRPSAAVRSQLQTYQRTTDCIIRALPFQRLVQQITREVAGERRFQSSAVLALQEAAEAYLADLFKDAQAVALYARRLTVTPRDLQLARRIRGEPPLSAP